MNFIFKSLLFSLVMFDNLLLCVDNLQKLQVLNNFNKVASFWETSTPFPSHTRAVPSSFILLDDQKVLESQSAVLRWRPHLVWWREESVCMSTMPSSWVDPSSSPRTGKEQALYFTSTVPTITFCTSQSNCPYITGLQLGHVAACRL